MLRLNYRMVHGFTCAGVLPSQYTHIMCKFVNMEVLGHDYIRKGLQRVQVLLVFMLSKLIHVPSPREHYATIWKALVV